MLTSQLLYAQRDHKSSVQKNIFLLMMDTMMVKMDTTPTSASTDVYFFQKMIPHHEGAVEMAKYEIMHGKDFGMIQLAKSIIAEQATEIFQMKSWVLEMIPTSSKMPADFQPSMNKTMLKMMDNMPDNSALTDTDKSFARVMIPHHQAAIDMAKVILKFTKNEQTAGFARQIISSQQVEIEQMLSFLK
jgi:uncharacterized protein (DUF305 family)